MKEISTTFCIIQLLNDGVRYNLSKNIYSRSVSSIRSGRLSKNILFMSQRLGSTTINASGGTHIFTYIERILKYLIDFVTSLYSVTRTYVFVQLCNRPPLQKRKTHTVRHFSFSLGATRVFCHILQQKHFILSCT